MDKFLEYTDINDAVHDVVFKVMDRYFPAHRSIIASRSEKLKNMIRKENCSTIELKDVNPDIFRQMLLFIYTGNCDLLSTGPCTIGFDSKSQKRNDPLKLLNECAKLYEVPLLVHALNGYTYQNGIIKKTSGKNEMPCLTFDRKQLLDFADVKIKTKNGKELLAHKCILAARMEYFNSMFSLRWNNNVSVIFILKYRSYRFFPSLQLQPRYHCRSQQPSSNTFSATCTPIPYIP